MSESQMKMKKKGALMKRAEIERYYRTKYFSLYMNAYEFEGLNSQQQRFLLSQLWEKGTINAFILEGSKPESIDIKNDTKKPYGELILTPYAPSTFNIYNYPIKITPIRLRGATFIPSKMLKVNDECVIGWGHSSHMPIRSIVEFYIEKIVDVEMTLRTNLFTHKMPRLVACSPEDKERAEKLLNDIELGMNKVFLSVDDIKNITNVLDGGGNYIVDKLYQYKLNLEKELMTMLGIDNIGIIKKERENNDEVNANNEEIDNGGDCFVDEMKIFTDLVTSVLGYPLSVREKKPRVTMMEYSNYNDEEGEQDNEN